MLAPTSYRATGGPPRPLDGRVQQPQLLAGRWLLADLAGAQAVHACQEAVHAVHAPRVPHLQAGCQGTVGLTHKTKVGSGHVGIPSCWRGRAPVPRSRRCATRTLSCTQSAPGTFIPGSDRRRTPRPPSRPRRALVSRSGPRNISYRRRLSAPYAATTSSGLTTLPRLLLILCARAATRTPGSARSTKPPPAFSTSASGTLRRRARCPASGRLRQ